MTKTRTLGFALVIFGVLVLIAAGFAYTYEQTIVPFTLALATYPYRSDIFPLILLSVVLLVLGFVLMVFDLEIIDYYRVHSRVKMYSKTLKELSKAFS
jgi:predicted membrane protein